MHMRAMLEEAVRTYTAAAYALTVICGLLTIMVERLLYARRGYRREAAICAFIGWTYVIGGTLLFVGLRLLRPWI